MKFKTVREGEQAVVYNYLGEGNLVIGPERVFLFRKKLQYLTLYKASQYEYLVVKMNSGLTEHIPGPCGLFCNPLEHQSINVEPAVKVDSNHILVVYRQLPDNSLQRRIIDGPTLFVPEAGERLHEFVWHGEDKSHQGRMIPGLNKFYQVPVIPDQFYYNVREVRTIDDTLLTVKLMLFYDLQDVLTMLEATHDPIADMINAVCADVISYAGKMTFTDFLSNSNQLSSLDYYPQLLQRAESVGYRISKVVYRGYHASEKLQAMQDKAIQGRTELRFKAALQEQQQKLVDFTLEKEHARTKLKQDMERSRQTHRQKIEKMKQNHESLMKEIDHTVKLECEQVEKGADLEHQKEMEEEKLAHLKQLHALGVDVTKYLVAQGSPPVDQEYKIVSK